MSLASASSQAQISRVLPGGPKDYRKLLLKMTWQHLKKFFWQNNVVSQLLNTLHAVSLFLNYIQFVKTWCIFVLHEQDRRFTSLNWFFCKKLSGTPPMLNVSLTFYLGVYYLNLDNIHKCPYQHNEVKAAINVCCAVSCFLKVQLLF